jgi:hypothetical protein
MHGLAMRLFRILEWPWRRRQRRLMATRDDYTKQDFARLCRARGASEKIVDEVWEALRAEAVVADFKPHPDDRIEKDYGLADEDKDEDLVLALLQRCGCRIPVPYSEEALNMGPASTVGELVDYLVKMKSPSPSSG